MKKITVTLASLAAVLVLTLGASAAMSKADCCNGQPCCNGGSCCRSHNHNK
ncbi:MAG TPA: hypothetical protein VKB88_44470 [Bryobacteraceae bacterium]|nr:hypothetical protein [Bryobacteraceae bacterium]